MSSLGERIRVRRKELGLTQSQLGGAELTKGFISLVEKGRANPSIDTLMLLARRLQKPIGYFLDDSSPGGSETFDADVQSARLLLKQGEWARAVEVYSAALNVAQQYHRPNEEAECCIGLASALANLRQSDLAADHAARGKELAETAGSAQVLARACFVLGQIEYDRHNLQAAREHFLRGCQVLHEHGAPDRALAGGLLVKLGHTCRDRGDHEEATRWFQEALAVLEPVQDLRRVGLADAQAGAASRENGHLEAALGHLTRAEHSFELRDCLRLLARAQNGLGILLLEQGKLDDAIGHLESGLQIKGEIGDEAGRVRILTALAQALVAKRAFAQAETALADAERLASSLQDTTEPARIQLVRARLLRESGRLPEAVAHYTQAISSLDGLGMRNELADACNELGELLIEQKRPSDAAPYLARALQELKPHRVTQSTAGEA